MEENLFYEAVQFARAGKKTEARGLIQQVLSADPFNEMAWLWYADCAADDEERIRDLEMGLRINPNMPRVIAGLRALQRGKPADLGRTQPVYIGAMGASSNGKKKHTAPFHGLDDAETPAQEVPLGTSAPFLEPSADDLIFEDTSARSGWANTFTILPDQVTPDEFAEIERRTVALLTKHPRPRFEDPWKSFREIPEPEPRALPQRKDNSTQISHAKFGRD